ncbi:GRP family sugar transporter [Algoriphagus taiwanensis]|uniref:GRP family sugar transporter n=1 Tax=Algoriphagus taiwanensis TaxID=1445656 RepID=A0ABQ6Q4H5_9BACT|nr:GRP family sugar transporter [Algoriphagus taiwanensis]
MFVIETYTTAVVFSLITMLCWGSWANTQKLASSSWRFELFYWDYVLGIVLLSLIFGLTLGSMGTEGRSFIPDLVQGNQESLLSAFWGGIIFNAANILLVAAIAISGMAVAFPVGIGLALVIGVIVNYLENPIGNITLLFVGVALVALAILLNATAYRSLNQSQSSQPTKGLILSLAAGILMGFFYKYVADSMFLDFTHPIPGKLSPYSAVFVFSLGIFFSNFFFNSFLMKRPFQGVPLKFSAYFQGSFLTHLTGILGGSIWCMGMSFSIIAADKAGPAISYGLGQGATMVAAFWGVFVWKEFKDLPPSKNSLLYLMFACFLIGLGLIIYSKLA